MRRNLEHHRALDQRQLRPRRRAHGPGDQPGHGQGHRPGFAREPGREPRRHCRGQGRVPRMARHLDCPPHPGPVPLPRAAQRPQGRTRRDHHRRARQGPVRRARRSHPRLRRSSSSPAASRTCSRAGSPRTPRPRSTSTRSASRSAGRHHQPVQLPGHGADVVLPARHRRRQHGGAQAVARRTRRPRTGWPSSGRRPACRTASSTSCTATRWPSTRLLDHPAIKAVSLRRLHPDRQVRLPDRHRQRQARPGPRRREEPHGRAARRRPGPGRRRRRQRRFRLGGRAVHGDLRRASRSARSPTNWSPRSPSGSRRLAPATAPRGCDMGPLVTGAHRDKVAGYIDAGEQPPVPRGRRRPRRRRRRRRRRVLARPDAFRQGDSGHVRLHATRSSARCCPSCGSTATTRRSS